MQAKTQGFVPLGDPRWRSGDGMLLDLWSVETRPGARGEYVSPHARLFVLLDQTEAATLRLSDAPGAPCAPAGPISYIPPGVPTFSLSEGAGRLRHIDLHVDLDRLQRRLGQTLPTSVLHQPRLMFANERILALARLLADDLADPGRHGLYAESLALGIWIEALAVPREPAPSARSPLSARTLRQLEAYLADQCLRPVRLADLAALAGLSPSYVAAAFKASTGVTPHQRQTQLRIARVQSLLASGEGSLSAIASATGFADQAHMTRAFKQAVGTTPAAWRRAQGFTPA